VGGEERGGGRSPRDEAAGAERVYTTLFVNLKGKGGIASSHSLGRESVAIPFSGNMRGKDRWAIFCSVQFSLQLSKKTK